MKDELHFAVWAYFEGVWQVFGDVIALNVGEAKEKLRQQLGERYEALSHPKRIVII